MRALLVCVIASLVPAAWIAIAGGADVDVGPWRVELYDARGAGLALAVGLGVTALPAACGRRRVLEGIVVGLLAFAAWIAWTGGIHTEAFRARSPDRAAFVAAALALAAWALAGGRLSARRAARAALPGLALGLAALVGVRAADRADLDRRIAAADADARTPDVLLILVDTLRADALGAYGAEPSPSPFLDGLAARSVVFTRALSQAEWTAPSVSSLLSSLYPSSFLWDKTLLSEERLLLLPEGMPWLPARLEEAGYHTAAFAKNPLLQEGTSFTRGFQVFEWVRGNTAELESGAELVDAVLRWGDALADRRAARGADGTGAYFAYVHFMDPHTQYLPPEPWRPREPYDGPVDGGVRSLQRLEKSEEGPSEADLARVRALYRSEVAYLDAELARLHDGLAARGLWTDDTIVLVVSDHGEQFFEHGAFFHGHVHWENLHVPFLVRAPGFAPRRVRAPVAMLDVAPTLLDLVGLEPADAMEGRSLVPQMRGEPLPGRVVISERTGGVASVRATAEGGALVLGDETWLELPAGGRVLSPDEAPPEAEPLVAELRRAHARHRDRPRPVLEGVAPERQALDPDADTAERLRALGYID